MQNPENRDSSGFLHARLAAAAAIPPERRSADVSVFIEHCQLQQEVLDALNQRGAARCSASKRSSSHGPSI